MPWLWNGQVSSAVVCLFSGYTKSRIGVFFSFVSLSLEEYWKFMCMNTGFQSKGGNIALIAMCVIN